MVMIDDVEGKKHTERMSSCSGSSTNSNKKQLACVCDLLSSELAFSSERVIRVRARNRCSNFQFRGAISSSFSSFALFFFYISFDIESESLWYTLGVHAHTYTPTIFRDSSDAFISLFFTHSLRTISI